MKEKYSSVYKYIHTLLPSSRLFISSSFIYLLVLIWLQKWYVYCKIYNLEEKLCIAVCMFVVSQMCLDSLWPYGWTVSCQAPLSIVGLQGARRILWSGLAFPSPGIFLTREQMCIVCTARWILYHGAPGKKPLSGYVDLNLPNIFFMITF